ncbi:hypothetical protein M378DRAFT_173604, partial [Amanita muscaria Koide BX008]
MTDGKIEYDNSVYREQTPVDVADESMKTEVTMLMTEHVPASLHFSSMSYTSLAPATWGQESFPTLDMPPAPKKI